MQESCADQEGWDRGFGPHLKNHKNIGFLSNNGPEPLIKSQSYQASIQCLTNIGMPAKCHLKSVSLASQ